MLKQRIITASILALVLVWAVVKLPSLVLGAALLLVVALGAWEWAALAAYRSLQQRFTYVAAVLGGCILAWPFVESAAFIHGVLYLSAAVWLTALGWLFHYATHNAAQYPQWLIALSGALMLVPTWLAMLALHILSANYLLFLLLLIWGADIGAYFAGRRWGRHKLAATISPGKTWEGVGGAAASVLLLALLGAAGFKLPALWFIALCLITAAFSIVGDLFESMLKRQSGVKDSSALLPGLGGILDRIDSLTAAAPLFLLGLHWGGL